jgi:GTP:adenosylcobinamide-phosphate guanylyltransferase
MANADNIARIPAVILAGGLNDDAMRAATGVENRAMVELTSGRTMLEYVVSAVTMAETVGQVVVVGDVPLQDGCTGIPSASSFLQNLINGVGTLPADTKELLVITSDIPFISPAAIEDFLQKALESHGDFCYPIIPMSIYRKQFKGMKRTTLKLRDGEFTGGNIMLVSASYVKDHQQTILAAYAARKDVAKLGRMLGWGLLFRVILSQTISRNLLDVRSLEKGVSKLLGFGAIATAIITEYASLGTDVDKLEDVAEARRILSQRSR